MQNRDEGLILADNAVQFEPHAKTNSGKAVKLRDRSEENARASNLGKCVAVDAVFKNFTPIYFTKTTSKGYFPVI